MSGFIRLVGSLCIAIFVGTIFFGDDFKGFFPDEYKIYTDDLINNKWMLLIAGLILLAIGSVTKVKDALKKNKQKNKKSDTNNNSFHDISSHENNSFRSSEHTSSYKNSSHNISTYNKTEIDNNLTPQDYLKKDFVKDQHQYKGREFAEKQTGHLKEIAMKVDWTPLAGGGSNFKTSLLKQVNSSRLEVHKSTGGFLFAAVFAIVGIASMVFGTYFVIADHGLSFTILIPILFGSIFAGAGIAMLIFPRPRIFDRRYGWFWCGNKSLLREQEFISLKESARLSDIAAIQIIDEYCSGSKGGSYRSWEINLVSKDAKRLNVMDHGNKDSISADAKMLADFLGVPIWDNT
ncbi:MAG: hypothetical protein ACI88H_002647 [Cocleimonas sp.]|jgi:hypothetical protein